MTRELRRRRPDAGFTLVELLVAMSILVIFFAIFGSVALAMFDSTGNQQARSVNTDVSRNVAEVLDRQVRYANAINAPGNLAGSQYVEWRAGSTGQPQTCYQWRVTPEELMQYRSWRPLLTGTTTATEWTTVGSGVINDPASPVFSITAPVATTGLNRQQLTVSYSTHRGNPPVSTATRLALTAVNTRTSSAPATPVCQEVARS